MNLGNTTCSLALKNIRLNGIVVICQEFDKYSSIATSL